MVRSFLRTIGQLLFDVGRPVMVASGIVFLAACVNEHVGDNSKMATESLRGPSETVLASGSGPGQSTIGPEVGSIAPQFVLPNAAGGRVSLTDFQGRKNVVLVFYRAFW
ncbi:MAG TPA: hypothetical protein DGO43_00985 [Chloroflexi bacterium]|nr:hypothetical protein [Chloroflexota bacterium]